MTERVQSGSIYRDVHERWMDARAAEDEAHLQEAYVADGRVVFLNEQSRCRAFQDGVFLLRIPPELELSTADLFARTFHLGSDTAPFGKYAELDASHFGDPLLGFHRRVHQIEQFLLERRFWHHYPRPIAQLGEFLTRLSESLINDVLAAVGIPPALRSLATGGCSTGAGSYHLTFNHYRPEHEGPGLGAHKDDGFVTILRITQPGLEINTSGRWQSVPVRPDCFVINFGLSMELLTEGARTPIAAILHRVAAQTVERSSFGHFSSCSCTPGSEQGVYRFDPHASTLTRLCAARELIDNNDYEIYQGALRRV